MSMVVGFEPQRLSDSGSASLFLPFRKQSGLCQNVSIAAVVGAFGSRLESSAVSTRILDGEEVGVDVAVVFADQKKVVQLIACSPLQFFLKNSML